MLMLTDLSGLHEGNERQRSKSLVICIPVFSGRVGSKLCRSKSFDVVVVTLPLHTKRTANRRVSFARI